MVLALLSIVGGYVSLPHAIGHLFHIDGDNLITQWLSPVLKHAKETIEASPYGGSHGSSSLEWTLMGTSTGIMVLMSLFAISLYKKGPEGGKVLADKFGGLYRLALDKWRIDELYQFAILDPLKAIGDVFYRGGDRAVVEGIVNEGPKGIFLITAVLSDLHTGLVRNYLKLIFVSIVLFVMFFAI
jgi:NADH-quinone oxidoreductase subunit L